MRKQTAMLVLAIGLFSGCSADTQQPAAESFFTPDGETTATARIFQAQAARGARADATLYPQHFDGDSLNSLGRAKLELALADNEAGPLNLYIAGDPSDPIWPLRASAVKQHLGALGVSDGSYHLIAGVNPHTLHPVARDLDAIRKSDGDKAPELGVDPVSPSGSAAAQ